MFAHFTQETGGHSAESVLGVPEWRQALMYVREMGYTETVRGAYAGECNPDTWQSNAEDEANNRLPGFGVTTPFIESHQAWLNIFLTPSG